jgi:DNA-directed RNA polymerase subunit alpha
MTEAELLKVRNFGKTSLKEVKSKLQALGLTLGLDVEEYSA